MFLIAQIPLNLFAQNLSEGFEDELFPPEGWTVINKGDSKGWERTTNYIYTINGDASACIHASEAAHNDWLITPLLAPTEGNYTISFYAKNYAIVRNIFNVKLSTTGTAEEDFTVVLAENINPPRVATKYEYDLSAYNGQKVYVAIQDVSTIQLNLIIDDFAGPSVFSPALDAGIASIENTAGYVSNHDIVVTLMNYGTTDLTACDINYSINGSTPSTYTWTGTLAKNTSEQVTIATDYDFTTQGDYIIEATVVLEGDQHLGNNTRSKTVAYSNPLPLPYFEGFEEAHVNGNAITGWSQQSIKGNGFWTANNTNTSNNRTPHTGNWNAYLRYANTDWMFTPKAILLKADKTYGFSMYARQNHSEEAAITVAYGTEPHDGAMVNTIVPTTAIINGDYQKIIAAFSPAETGFYYIGIKGDIGYSPMYLSIDDISIRIVHSLNYIADGNGTITGEAFQIVDPSGDGTPVTAVANDHYHFVQWSDGSTENPRTDANVNANIEVTAEFAIDTYTIGVTSGANGEITPASEQTVEHGSNATFAITPNTGFYIASVLVDSVSVGLPTTYTFSNISDNHTISTTFSNAAATTHAITATAGLNGSISPSGVVPVFENGDITFTITANKYHNIKDVLVDGVSVGNVSTYTFENATAAHTIEAEFTPFVNALHFDGTNDYVAFPTMPTTIDLSQGFSFAAWVKWDAFTGNARIMEIGNGANGHSDDILLRTDNGTGRLLAEVANNTTNYRLATDGAVVTPNVWHHVALTLDNNHGTIYIDGVAVKSGTLATPRNVERENVNLGKSKWTGDKYFKGRMDEVSFWNKALTKNDILHSMKTDITGTETELFGYYKFNQGIKDGSNAGETSLSDSSTFNRNGALKNFALTGATSNWVDGYDATIQTLTIETVANGTLSAIPSEGIVTGSEIAIIVTPDLGSTLTSIQAYKTGSTSTVVRINVDAEGNQTIIMPAFDVTLTAEFTINTYTLNYTAGANGSLIGETTQTVNYDTNGTPVTAVAANGYHFVQWSDGVTENPRTDVNVIADVDVTAEFAINTYTIAATAGDNGTIALVTKQTFEHGSNATFAITPNAGFFIASVLVDSVSVGLPTSYSFKGISDNHTISATFSNAAPTTHAITATAGLNGSISPSGVVPVVENGDITFTITANKYHNIKDVLVDGVSVGNVSSYTFANATAVHTIEAEFTPFVNALHFDGINDYVAMPTLPTTTDLSQGFSFAAWVKWDAFTGDARIMEIGNGENVISDDIYLRIDRGTGKLVAQVANNTSSSRLSTDNQVVVANIWYHVALTINPIESSSNSDVTIYVNGVSVKNGTVPTPNNVERENVWLGKSKWNADVYFKGSMDEVSFWNKALTKNDILNSMKTDIAGTETELFGYYKFNQGIKGGNNGDEISLSDLSTSIRNGTLNNFALTGTSSNWVDGYDASIQTLTVTPPVANGTLSATPTEGIVAGSEIAITTTPEYGYHLVVGGLKAYKTDDESVVVRINVDAEGNQTIIMPAFDVTLTAEFAINAYTVIYNAGANGSLTGETSQTVNHGSDGTPVTAVANVGYHFVQWSDDYIGKGKHGSTSNPRTDVNVTENLSYTAEFAINTYTITATSGANGEITPAGEQTVEYGSNHTYTITPSAGFYVSSVYVDGMSVGIRNTYTFNNITNNHTISATFSTTQPTTIAITANAGLNGSISPNGEIHVVQNENMTFTILPDYGYSVSDVFVDGVSVGSVLTYTFENVAATHTIAAEFAVSTFNLSYTAGANGTLEGEAIQTVNHGTDGTAVTAVANDGYHFAQWSDGVIDNPRTDVSVIADITVVAEFALTINALHFDGINDYVALPTMPTSIDLSQGFSFAAWVKWDEFTGNARVMEIGYSRASTYNDILLRTHDGTGKLVAQISYFSTNYEFTTDTEVVTANSWYHVALTINPIANSTNSDITIYVNGVPVKNDTLPTPVNTTRGNVWLGKSKFSADPYFKGSMDEVSFWNKALTNNEVLNSMLIDIANEETGLIGYYKFNHGIPNGNNSGVSTLSDYSALGRNGTLRYFSLTGTTSNRVDGYDNSIQILTTSVANGTITATPTEGMIAGNEITFTYTPDLGYRLTEGSVRAYKTDDESVEVVINVDPEGNQSFIMPAFGVTLTATFSNLYTLAYTTDGNGSITGEATQTVEYNTDGTPVTAVANDGYQFAQWSDSVTANPRTDVNITGDVTFEAQFEGLPQVLTIATVPNGTLSATPTEGIVSGSEIIITATPAYGYNLTQGSVRAYKTDNESVVVAVNVNTDGKPTITMPAYGVTITAEFSLTNNALHFDGTDDYVALPELSTDIDLSQEFSFAAWVKWDEFTGNARILDMGNGVNGHSNDIVLRTVDGTGALEVEIARSSSNSNLRTDAAVVTTNTWYHVAMTINPMANTTKGDVTLYINGVPVKNQIIHNPRNVARGNVWLGKSHWNEDKYFKGRMDEVSFWNKTLTKNDIVNTMLTNVANDETELFGYYKFNQGVVSSNNSSETTLSDSSSLGRNGTLNNLGLTGITSNWVYGYNTSTQTLTVATVANGTIHATPAEGMIAGNEITITDTPDLGYRLAQDSLRAYKTNDESAVVAINFDAEGNRTFIMPAFGVTLTAAFSNMYTISYTADANGSITGEATQIVEYGTDGTLVTAVANDGYQFAQ